MDEVKTRGCSLDELWRKGDTIDLSGFVDRAEEVISDSGSEGEGNGTAGCLT